MAAGLARSYWTLARWLGPWASETAQPPVDRRTVHVRARAAGERAFDAWLYLPADRPVTGAYLIAPGLHYAGPRDPRLDRFCAIVAASGYLVLAPFLPDFAVLRVEPTAITDLDRTFAAMLELPEMPPDVRPGVFSISFGSLLALRLAAAPHRADQVGGLVLFGGYADWGKTIHYCLTGEIDGRPHGTRDPLNQPVVFMNLMDYMDDKPDDPAPLFAAWRAYVEATWGRPEMKADGVYQSVAARFEAGVPGPLREWYRVGVGTAPGAVERCTAALRRLGDDHAFLDPRPHLAGIRCPVHLIHGVDDDVIPYPQSEEIAAALPAHVDAQLYLTGLYGHTARAGVGGRLREVPAMARELWTMIRMLNAMLRTGRGR